MKEYTNEFKEVHTWIWEDAVVEYCEEKGLDINDIYLPEHESNIIDFGVVMWHEENPNCRHLHFR